MSIDDDDDGDNDVAGMIDELLSRTFSFPVLFSNFFFSFYFSTNNSLQFKTATFHRKHFYLYDDNDDVDDDVFLFFFDGSLV